VAGAEAEAGAVALGKGVPLPPGAAAEGVAARASEGEALPLPVGGALLYEP
jgi:hypothetical protein